MVDMLAHDNLFENGECRVIVRTPESKSSIIEQGLVPIKADLTDPDSLKIAIKDVDVVFNLAALATDWASKKELFKVNVEGMKNLLEACLDTNSDPFLVHTSSTGVYGHFIPNTPIDENYRFNPTSIYQESKYYQEKAIWDVQAENGWTNFGIIRPPSVVGPRDMKTMFGIFKAVYEQKFPIMRKGEGYLTFIHPYDMCSALLLLVEKRNQVRGQAYNLKSFECKLIDFLDYIVKKINPPKPPKHINYRMVYTMAVLSEIYAKLTGKHTTLNRYRVTKFALSRRYNDHKIRQLGFEPQKSMKTTIDESYNWLIHHNLFPPHP
ncbi:MAG: NAD-dependent epimerase/dehydratase family protein [Candidatus Heimdallarchaeota archaeon]|nr:MAG: NAD-dependent epimerase/dehydratase family protein [Candidatus Heimdallarchaeota archaeon]